ncbi:protein SHQ1 homolog [Daktulosphaira vitifoliae]|uniref:protein SHQ1 homolog n=1 Tax=Daktulosphaira vitifoliae TaxID=58002 RepID=UPI0021AA3961|nr:protein SHQ1 homolog [Daktulosphaira vitifoliae]XP_050528709.1 protein SHQ1 homolog [Daktulosphaira vitifoliae]XP_050528710.1 protein SHQ1 homolog [Daktulosphaira vitifoliae]
MITPNFELSQTYDHLIVKIKARFANVANTETDINEDQFIFYSSPYYLRLHLPGEIVENDSSTGSYDWDSYTFTFKLSKVNPGKIFPDLNLINKFLIPKKKLTTGTSIEIIGECSNNETDDDINCDFFQKPLSDDNNSSMKYGFANQTENAFRYFNDEFFEIIELKNPDEVSFKNRKSLQFKKELSDFSEDHYLADLMTEPDELKEIMNFQPFWLENLLTLAESEKSILTQFGNKEYLLNQEDKKSAILSLVDIIYAYCYNCRVFMGEESCESSWLINKLSSTLSWFRSFDTFNETIISCLRRSLCYPLYRNWELSNLVLTDVQKVFENGYVCLLKCLLNIYKMFNSDEPRYILNQLYIKDYCIWIQQLNSKHFKYITKLFDEQNIFKQYLELDLDLLEMAALSVLEDKKIIEETLKNNDHSIEAKLEKLQISSSESNLDSDDYSSDETE